MTLLKQTKFLNFTNLPPTGKTKIIGVGNNQGHKLAYIKWDTGWRRYVFLPLGGTQFDVACLKDISDFITELMDERKVIAKEDLPKKQTGSFGGHGMGTF